MQFHLTLLECRPPAPAVPHASHTTFRSHFLRSFRTTGPRFASFSYCVTSTQQIEERASKSEGVPDPGGRSWGDTTVRGHLDRDTGIPRNQLYIAQLVWNRQRYVVKDPVTGKRRSQLNPASQWPIEEVPHLRIIEQS